MKQKTVTITSRDISQKEWSSLLLELNLLRKDWKSIATLEMQGTGLKKILAHGTRTEKIINNFKQVTKTLIVLILLFNGELVKEKFEIPIAMTVYECLDFSEKYRETITVYKNNSYYLKDGRGTLQGFIC